MATSSADKKQADTGLAKHVAEHYNKREEKGVDARYDSRIFYMRNFNNWIKSVLINEFLNEIKTDNRMNISVLDLACGKGGDLLKWKMGRIRHLICADIAETSVKHCQGRYEEMKMRQRDVRDVFSAEFHTADCSKIRLKNLYRDTGTQFDLTSCQFSFHYTFETYSQAKMMMTNACESLKEGGYFIGTIPNGNEIVRRLRDAKGLSFGNDVYNIKFCDKSDFPLFGCKYNFHLEGVVDCPEFLVYFPVFEELAKNQGMRLVYRKTFAEFFDENASRNKGLLSRMKALETYPPDKGTKLMSDRAEDYLSAKCEYEHAEEADGRSKDEAKKIGTLSAAEWEATSLYDVFAFKKVSSEMHYLK